MPVDVNTSRNRTFPGGRLDSTDFAGAPTAFPDPNMANMSSR